MNIESEEEYHADLHHHFSPYFGGNASEFIVPKLGKIDITSHGMGSGIYGLSNSYISRNTPDMEEGSSRYTFKLELPYVIVNQEECDRYSSTSMKLSRNMEKLRKKMIEEPNSIFTIDNMIPIAKEFIKDIQQEFDLDTTATALLDFFNDYYNRNDFVEMPINYILKADGNDGVLSEVRTSCHSWGKGDVKFLEHYPLYKERDIQPVNNILTRDGFQRNTICLGYKYDGENWVYPSKENLRNAREISCPRCIKKCRINSGHPIWMCPERQKI